MAFLVKKLEVAFGLRQGSIGLSNVHLGHWYGLKGIYWTQSSLPATRDISSPFPSLGNQSHLINHHWHWARSIHGHCPDSLHQHFSNPHIWHRLVIFKAVMSPQVRTRTMFSLRFLFSTAERATNVVLINSAWQSSPWRGGRPCIFFHPHRKKLGPNVARRTDRISPQILRIGLLFYDWLTTRRRKKKLPKDALSSFSESPSPNNAKQIHDDRRPSWRLNNA